MIIFLCVVFLTISLIIFYLWIKTYWAKNSFKLIYLKKYITIKYWISHKDVYILSKFCDIENNMNKPKINRDTKSNDKQCKIKRKINTKNINTRWTDKAQNIKTSFVGYKVFMTK